MANTIHSERAEMERFDEVEAHSITIEDERDVPQSIPYSINVVCGG